MATHTSNETKVLDEITSIIVQEFHPQKLILFGSRARGEAQENSDYDLLIIAPSSEVRWKRTIPVYRLLAGLGVAKEVLWWTPEEIEEWRTAKSHPVSRALREGRVLYERRS